MEVSPDELREAVESQHGGQATFLQTVPVREEFEGQVVWQGLVHVFGLKQNDAATVAYAWSHAVDESDKRRFVTVLGVPPINSAAKAVRAALVAEARSKT